MSPHARTQLTLLVSLALSCSPSRRPAVTPRDGRADVTSQDVAVASDVIAAREAPHETAPPRCADVTAPTEETGHTSPVAALLTAGRIGCVRMRDDTVRCWNPAALGGPVVFPQERALRRATHVAPLDGARQIAPIIGSLRGFVVLDREGHIARRGAREDDAAEGPVPVEAFWNSPTPFWPDDTAATHMALISDENARGCVLDAERRVRCVGFGVNFNGDQPAGLNAAPHELEAARCATRLASNSECVCAITRNARVVCWGGGNGVVCAPGHDEGAAHPPTEVAGLTDVVDVSLGSALACAVSRDGALRCWGRNAHCESDAGAAGTCVMRALPPVAHISIEGAYACALTRAGEAWCWRASNTAAPRAVAGLRGITQLVTASDAACALRDDGAVWCWGDIRERVNREGEVESARIERPTRVRF